MRYGNITASCCTVGRYKMPFKRKKGNWLNSVFSAQLGFKQVQRGYFLWIIAVLGLHKIEN